MTPLRRSSGQAYAEVIGDPIEHSKSPLIHRFWLEKLDLPGEYRATSVRKGGLGAYLEERRGDPDWRGCNVTMPLKREALLAAGDNRLDRAELVGAANILLPVRQNFYADNSDVQGVEAVLRMLTEGRAPVDITLLGSGGAARAALVACRRLGCDAVSIRARDAAAAMQLTQEFQLSRRPQPWDAAVSSEGLINATPLGMVDAPPLEVELAHMPAAGWVFDMVTAPPDTGLVQAARRAGLRASGGLPMLIEQAAVAFAAFFGAPPPREHDAELRELLTA